MTEKDSHPNASHIAFPYYFDSVSDDITTPNDGIFFQDKEQWVVESWKYNYDLAIYYDTLEGDNFIDCRCSRWDVDNYSFIVETWIKKNHMQDIISNIRPGAAGEFYKIVDRPIYADQTWTSDNTLRFLPTPSSTLMNDSKLKNLRQETLGFIKNVTTHPISNTDWIEIKFECYRSGSNNRL